MKSKNKLSDEGISQILNDSARVTQIIQLGIQKALTRHKQAGNSVCEIREGKIVWIPPEEIPIFSKR